MRVNCGLRSGAAVLDDERAHGVVVERLLAAVEREALQPCELSERTKLRLPELRAIGEENLRYHPILLRTFAAGRFELSRNRRIISVEVEHDGDQRKRTSGKDFMGSK
jgi:hypothetical protein